MDAFSKHCLNFFVCFFLKKNLLSLRHISQLYERKKAIVFWCYKFRHVSTCYDKFRHVTTGLHRFCLSFKDISQLLIFFLDFFFVIFFSCMYLCKLFFSSRLYSCFFSIHTAHFFFLLILFHDCTTFVFLAMFWAP